MNAKRTRHSRIVKFAQHEIGDDGVLLFKGEVYADRAKHPHLLRVDMRHGKLDHHVVARLLRELADRIESEAK